MSYPNYPGYPPGPPASNSYFPTSGYPPASGGGGIGFEPLLRSAQPSSPYGQTAAPYPTGHMPVPGYGSPQPPLPYGAPPIMPSPNAPPAYMPGHAAPMTFAGAAHTVQAAVAFQAQPIGRMPTPNANVSYNPAAAYGNNVFHNVAPPVQPPRNPPHHDSRNSSFHGSTQVTPRPVQPSHNPPHHDSRNSSFHGSTQVHSTSSSGKPVQNASTPPSNSGTVKPHPNFNPEVDAAAIRKAVAGFGTNVKEIINILFTRTNSQRLKIALEYKTSLGRDLRKDVEHALGGSLEKLLKGLLQTPAEYDAGELRDAVKGAGTKESVLIEILCSRTNAELVAVKQQYIKEFGRDLEKDVHSDTSGHFRKFMTSILQANRDETNTVDYAKAKADADALHKAGEKRWGTDESRFNAIFASRSYAQLRATFNEYAKISKFDIEKSVEREMSGDLKNAMTALVQCVRNTPAYFAAKLYKSMKGVGTDDGTLIRIIVSRCEVDMVIIKQEFQKMYSKTLASFIKGDTSGNYCKTLLGLIGESE